MSGTDDDLDALLDAAIDTMNEQERQHEAERAARDAAAAAHLVAEQQRTQMAAASVAGLPPTGATGDEAKLLEAVQALMSILSKGPEALEKAPDDEMKRVQEVLASTLETMKNSTDMTEAEHAQISQCSDMLRKIEKTEHSATPPTPEEIAEMQKLMASMAHLSQASCSEAAHSSAAGGSASGPVAAASSALPSAAEMTDEVMAEHLKRIQELQHDTASGAQVSDQQLGDLLANLLKPESIVGPFRAMAKAYPLWFEKNSGSVPPAELHKYHQQHMKMVEVCDLLDQGPLDNALKPEATDEDRDRLSKFSTLLEELHGFGAPPESLHELIAAMSKP
jgi:hypothetical protein